MSNSSDNVGNSENFDQSNPQDGTNNVLSQNNSQSSVSLPRAANPQTSHEELQYENDDPQKTIIGVLQSYAKMQGNDLLEALSQSINPMEFISEEVLKNKAFYNDFRMLLYESGIKLNYPELPNQTPTAHRIIKALWPDRYDELTQQWTINRSNYAQRRRLYKEETHLHSPP